MVAVQGVSVLKVRAAGYLGVLRSLFGGLILLFAAASGSAETLTLVAENDWYPYAADRNGEARGISVDIVRAAYELVGVEVEFKLMSYARCMELLDLGEEIGCFNTPDDDSIRLAQLLPEHPLDINPAFIYTRTDNDAGALSLEQLGGKAVGIVNGYRYGNAFMQDPDILREYSPSDLQNLKKLSAGRLDYIVLYERVARYLIGLHGQELGISIKQVTPIGRIAIFVSFSQYHPRSAEAMRLFDLGMERLKSDGRYEAILGAWDARLDATHGLDERGAAD